MTITKSVSAFALALAAFAAPGTADAADKATAVDKSSRSEWGQPVPGAGRLLDPATGSPGAGPTARCDELRGEARMRCVDSMDSAVAGSSSAGRAGSATTSRRPYQGGYYVDHRGGQDPTY